MDDGDQKTTCELEFVPYSDEALKLVLPYMHERSTRSADLSAGYVYMWQEDTDVRFCVWHDTFVMRQIIGDQPAFSLPVGKDISGMIDQIILYAEQEHLPLRFYAVDEDRLDLFQQDERLMPAMKNCDGRWNDYLYAADTAMTFRGKKFSGQRNHVNRFIREYGQPVIRFITAEDDEEIGRMLDEYEKGHAGAITLEKFELQRSRQLLKNHRFFGLPAACLVIDGHIAAVSLGEVIGDMLVIHVEKALTRYHGIYPVMYSGFVRLVAEQCGIPLKLVNREDDSGDEGLRNSKLQYKPCGMVRKYLVHVRTPAAYVKEYPVLTDGVVVLDQIRENDKRAYLELNTDIENNRYWGYDYREDVMFTGPPDEDIFYTSLMNDMRAGDSMNFAVRLKGHDEMIGEVLLWQFTSDGRAEAGCRIASAYHGHGYGKRAFSLLTEYGQKQMQLQVHARCYHENHASYVMITSSGFKESGQDETFVYFEKTD